MKKIKFLSCTALAAFMALGFASCEKENFNTESNVTVTPPTINIPGIVLPPSYQPGDAVVSIQPKVNALINGAIMNVTEDAKIKINSEEKPYEVITGSTISARTVTIEVSYTAVVDGIEKELSATDNVEVPDLKAGMAVIITPTIWLSIDGESYDEMEEEVGETTWNKWTCTLTNNSNYWYSDATAELKYIEPGVYLAKSEIEEAFKNDAEVNKMVKALTEGLDAEPKEASLVMKNVTVYAQSLTIIPYEQAKKPVTYTFYRNVEWSRSTKPVKTASVTIEEYDEIKVGEIKTNINLQGEGHGHGHYKGHGHSHGFDHGHGADNAGGGMIEAL